MTSVLGISFDTELSARDDEVFISAALTDGCRFHAWRIRLSSETICADRLPVVKNNNIDKYFIAQELDVNMVIWLREFPFHEQIYHR